MNTGESNLDRQAADAVQYTRFDGVSEFQQALDTLLDLPGRELRIFDPDMEALRLNSVERIARLQHFLLGSRTRRVYLAVHDTDHITKYCPRLLQLLARYTHAIQINRTDESIRELQDSFAVIDANHYLRRPVARLFRGALGVNDETEALSMRARFMEIWSASFPAVSGTTAGL